MNPEDFKKAQQIHSEIQSFEEAIKEGIESTYGVKHMSNDIHIEFGDSLRKNQIILKKEFLSDLNKFLLEKYKAHLEKLKEEFNQI